MAFAQIAVSAPLVSTNFIALASEMPLTTDLVFLIRKYFFIAADALVYLNGLTCSYLHFDVPLIKTVHISCLNCFSKSPSSLCSALTSRLL